MNEIIWKAIHEIERATAKDGLYDMSRSQLERLVRDVYYTLKEVEQITD